MATRRIIGNIKSTLQGIRAKSRGRKADKLRVKLVTTRKRLSKATEDRVTQQKRLTGTGKPVVLRKSLGEERLAFKKKAIRKRAIKFLGKSR